MAYDRISKRSSRNRSRNSEPLPVPQQGWRGVNYVDNIYEMQPHQLPYGQNVDLGSPIGSISKVAGREALFASLGTGRMICHTWKHPDGDKLIGDWGEGLYMLSGDSGSIAKSSKADWDAGTGTNLDTTSSPGDAKINLGTAFSETDTVTADFDGTHTQTLAISDKVTLDLTGSSGVGRYYIQNAAAGYDPATERGAWDNTASHIVKKLSKTKAGSVDLVSVAEAVATSDYDVLLLKAVTDALPGDKAISGTLSFCLAVVESSGNANDYYHVHVFVTQGDSDNVRGTLLSNNISASEWPTTVAGLEVSGLALSSVNALAGDRVVIEIGYRASNTLTSSYTGTIVYGGTGATDLTNGATDYNKPGWFEFSTDLVNSYYSSGTYTHGAQDISGVKIVNAATITFDKTTPANTTLTFQYRLSTDSGVTWGSWATISSGDTIISSGTDVSAYRIQWQALLTTTDTGTTPSLDSVAVVVTVPTAPTGTWISTALDQVNTPLTSVLSWSVTTPAGTTVTWYARGSGNGTVWGDWREILASGDAIPLLRYVQIKFILTGTATATSTVSSLLISYSTNYSVPNLLDISPLGRTDDLLTGNRVSMEDYEDRCYCADGLRPFVLYVDDTTAVTGTAQSGGATAIRLAAGASAVNDFFNNALITITGGTGSGQVRYISDYVGATKDVTVSEAWTTNPDVTSTYSIGAAVKVRKAGVDPPATACSAADGGGTGITGTFRYKITFVNRDGYESNPSAASGSVTVSNKIVALSSIPTGDATITQRKVYRTKTGGSVYYYVATIANNTATTYSDTTADGSLTVLMLDNNNTPPAAVSLVYRFLTYMFYVSNDELWFSKAGEPESCPDITGDIQVIICAGTILDIKSNPMALIPMGDSFIAPITTNSGFVFDSDPTVDTTSMKTIDKNGCFSAWASDICISPDLRQILVFPTNTGVRTLLPGLQEGSIESIPLSRNVQPYFDRSVNRTNMAGIFFESRYIISFEHMAVGAAESEYITFCYDFRTSEWNGPWTFGASCYTISGNVLYAGDPEAGKIYRMFTGSSDSGANIKLIADLPMISPQENRTYKFNNFMLMLSADSDTTDAVVKPKVDDREATVALGALTSAFTGDVRPGHDNIRTKKYRIPLPRGNTLSYRIEDDSTNPVSIQKVISEIEPLRLKK